MDFRRIVSSLLNEESTVNTEHVNSIHHVLVSKLANQSREGSKNTEQSS